MTDRTVASVLADAEETLETAELGLADLIGQDPRRRRPGLRNVVIFGRAFTNVLQNLRSIVGPAVFDEWYLPHQDKMRNDELLRYFYQLRSEILKEGRLQTTFSMHTRFTGDDLSSLLQNAPPGAKRFVMGDNIGGNCWEVELPGGGVEKYYVTLPERLAQNTVVWYDFPDPPQTHAGADLLDTSVENLARLYIEWMRNLLEEAKLQFMQ